MLTDEELAEIERVWAAARDVPGAGDKRNGQGVERMLYIATSETNGIVDPDAQDALEKAPEHIAALLDEVKRARVAAERWERTFDNETDLLRRENEWLRTTKGLAPSAVAGVSDEALEQLRLDTEDERVHDLVVRFGEMQKRVGELELRLEEVESPTFEQRDWRYYEAETLKTSLRRANSYAASLERRLEALGAPDAIRIAPMVEKQNKGEEPFLPVSSKAIEALSKVEAEAFDAGYEGRPLPRREVIDEATTAEETAEQFAFIEGIALPLLSENGKVETSGNITPMGQQLEQQLLEPLSDAIRRVSNTDERVSVATTIRVQLPPELASAFGKESVDVFVSADAEKRAEPQPHSGLLSKRASALRYELEELMESVEVSDPPYVDDELAGMHIERARGLLEVAASGVGRAASELIEAERLEAPP